MNKTTLRIPLGQFGFAELEYDHPVTNKALVETYKDIQNLYKDDQYEHSHINGVNWRKKAGKWEYLEEGAWVSGESPE